jgi:cupin 2 domain-containing protein
MNLLSYDIPPKDKEFFNTLLSCKNVTIKQIISNTLSTPQTFCSKEDEFVVVLKGCAKIKIGDEVKKLKTADTLFIPANTPHTLLKTRQVVVWLAIYIK